MFKKLMMACMAIAAFAAFVIAPSASATTLTDEGKSLAVGASLEGLLTNEALFTTSAGNVKCSKAVLKGTVTQNNGSVAKGEIPVGSATYKGTGAGEDCTSTLFTNAPVKAEVNSKLCLETLAGTDNVKITGCGANVTFTLNFTGVATCKYQTASVSGSFTTNTTPTPVTVDEQPATGESTNGPLCPSEGKLDMTFDVYTTGGTVGVTIS